MNQILEILFMLTIVNIVICKIYQYNQYIHTSYLFITISVCLYLFSIDLLFEFSLIIVSFEILNIILSIFLIIANKSEKKKK